jgi:hypothetical protein
MTKTLARTVVLALAALCFAIRVFTKAERLELTNLGLCLLAIAMLI